MRALHFSFLNIEPRKKSSMSAHYKAEIQQLLLDTMKSGHRRAFSGKVALRIKLFTTDNNPTQSHHVAKNLLDLFSVPTFVKTRRSGLLYYDDRQVHSLSVTSFHGNDEPSISVEAHSLSDFLEDVRLASDIQQGEDKPFRDDDTVEAISEFRQMRHGRDRWKRYRDDCCPERLAGDLKRDSAKVLGGGRRRANDRSSLTQQRAVKHQSK